MKRIILFLLISLLITGCGQTINPGGATDSKTEDVSVVVKETITEVEMVSTGIPEPTGEPTVEIVASFERIKNIYYVEGGTSLQRLDLYLPSGVSAEETSPIIMMIHPGYSTKGMMFSMVKRYVNKGFSVISIDYRENAPYLYEDGVCALGWIYENAAEHGFNLDQIYLLGYSLGGTVAAFLGTVDDFTPYESNCPSSLPDEVNLAGVISFAGIFDYPAIGEDEESTLYRYVVGMMGGNYDIKSAVWQENSPITHIDGSEPEFILFHGEKDSPILPSYSVDFGAALEEAGVEVAVHIIPDSSHGEIFSNVLALEFLTEFLLNRIQ